MKSDKLEEIVHWGELSYLSVLAKAVLLDKVSIIDGRIMVKAFKDDE